MAHGYADGINPRAFAIVNGKLYLNLTRGINRSFLRSAAANITSGDKRWPRVRALLTKNERY